MTGQKASLDHLPPELMLMILMHLDFASIWDLINTSKKFADVSDSNALRIVKAALHLHYPGPIAALMRAVVQIRIGAFQYEKTWIRAKHIANFCSITTSPALFFTAPVPLLKKLVALAAKIHLLAHLCLAKCRQNCLSRCQETGHRYREQYFRDVASKDQPPLWMEHQRAVLAFWRVQYFLELQTGRRKGRLRKWSRQDLEELRSCDISSFYDDSSLERLKVMAVIRYLRDFDKFDINDIRILGLSDDESWQDSPGQFRLPRPARGDKDLSIAPQVVYPEKVYDSTLTGNTIAWDIVNMITSAVGSDDSSVRDQFAELGFAFWEQSTVIGMKLWAVEEPLAEFHMWAAAWWSFLSCGRSRSTRC